jgi:hypothetical protein
VARRSNFRADRKVARFAASSDDGEGRNRTGDTTIFRDPTLGLRGAQKSCKSQLADERI